MISFDDFMSVLLGAAPSGEGFGDPSPRPIRHLWDSLKCAEFYRGEGTITESPARCNAFRMWRISLHEMFALGMCSTKELQLPWASHWTTFRSYEPPSRVATGCGRHAICPLPRARTQLHRPL